MTTKAQRRRQAIGLIIFSVLFVVIGLSTLIFRDYKLKRISGSLQLVAAGVPTGGAVTLDASEPNKLKIYTNSLSGVEIYEFQVSRFKSMMFAHTYRAETPQKSIGMMKSGKTYYVRVRGYRNNSSGRLVHGAWGMKRSAKVK